jgi:hypothetical protein
MNFMSTQLHAAERHMWRYATKYLAIFYIFQLEQLACIFIWIHSVSLMGAFTLDNLHYHKIKKSFKIQVLYLKKTVIYTTHKVFPYESLKIIAHV